ncbi:hypothetical protein [Actinomycetospora sp. TBRC 11914]|uniref:hypothetical protein n=1 Tax=Actinomycetospora sp. TBRC 11914 TaxID=2729387 RepID=UPI00145C5E09|nr:hypothetical protein [Actinomycetospora sp. TBRC 11914]NMO90328.1 hypothetical protein [Actinomycetospora sp. TBRC 11914]
MSVIADMIGDESESEKAGALRACCSSRSDWNAALSGLPLEPATFLVYVGVRRPEFVARLERWLSERPVGMASDDRAMRGFLAVLYITLVTMQEAGRDQAGVTDAAEHQRTSNHLCDQTCREFVSEPEVREALIALYRPDSGLDEMHAEADSEEMSEWTSILQDGWTLVRHGSTSVILKARARKRMGQRAKLVLKILLLPYANVPLIANETEKYAQSHNAEGREGNHISTMVHVWSSTRRWIIMDFVEGTTLREAYLGLLTRTKELDRRGRADGNVRLDLIRRLAIPLLVAMAELRRNNKVHEDLSPSNVMFTPSADGRSYSVTFIDFGRNYLYTRAVGGPETPDGTFVAPEVRDDREVAEENAWRTDLYSIGKILIMLGNVGSARDGVIPDRFYGQAPLVARAVEDLIDSNPSRRLLVFADYAVGRNPYEGLAVLLTQELDATQGALVSSADDRDAAVPYDHDTVSAALGSLLPLSREPKKRYRVYRVRKRQEHVLSDPRRSFYARWLLRFSILASFTYYITALVSILWFLRDLGIDVLGPGAQVGMRALGLPQGSIPFVDDLQMPTYHLGEVISNLPARVIGLSFALIGSRYYQNILGSFTTRVADSPRLLGGVFRGATEFVTRLMAVWSLPLILACNLVNPRWWPIASAMGYTGVLFANLSSASFADRYLRRGRELGLSTLPGPHQKITGLDGYRQWGPSMAFYVIIVWAFAVPIYLGVLKDTGVYVTVVAAVNIGLFYIIKTGANALDVRTGLNRAVLASERVRCLADGAQSSRVIRQEPMWEPIVRNQ